MMLSPPVSAVLMLCFARCSSDITRAAPKSAATSQDAAICAVAEGVKAAGAGDRQERRGRKTTR